MSEPKTGDLSQIRQKIDALDTRIVDLLNERTALAVEIGRAKKATGQGIYAPERESQIYQMLENRAKDGLLPKNALKAIYREIMSASLALEKPLTIAYLGPEASFTHLASLSKFGSSVSYFPTATINEVFREVEKGLADYGVIPIENSTEGAVNHSLDMFIDSELKICSEILFQIQHNLMASCDIKSIKRVYSHPQVFGQCRRWIDAHLSGVELVETVSTTQAAQKAQREQGAAAIASKLAGTLYNLPILVEGVQDFAKNVTRFLVIAQHVPKPTKKDKTSILVSVKDKVGALYDILLPMKRYRMNMTKIESRPSKKKPWEYYFYIDIEGHADDPKTRKMLDRMDEKVKFLKILGSYPASVVKES